MEVRSENFGGVFKHMGDVHFVLPRFQRSYAWRQENWQTFWDDVITTFKSKDDKPEHFMGTIVVVGEGMRDANMPTFTLVDGQQRLITISTVFCALADLVDDENLKWRIRRYLINEKREGDLTFKVLPTENSSDKATWMALVKDEKMRPFETRSRITEAYDFFRNRAQNFIEGEQADPDHLLNTVMNCLQIVFINLSREEKPHQIFESLNAKGVHLTQPDLVRNYIAMRLSESEQDRIFRNYWRPIEEMLIEEKTKESPGKELTNFLRHYLASLYGVLPKLDQIYIRFRERMQEELYRSEQSFIREIKTLHRFAGYYTRLLRPENETHYELQKQLDRLKNWEVTVSYPFLLYLYDEYDQGKIASEDLLNSLSLIENYLVRRHLVGESTAYLNKMFPVLQREIDRANPGESLKRALEVKYYPSDNRLRQSLLTRPIGEGRYSSRLVFILSTINRHLSKGSGGRTILDDKPTVEHIMPQTLDNKWKQHLGENWPIIHRDYLHTLGNLTLVTRGWNSSLSNSEFINKRSRLTEHGLLINSSYFKGGITKWNECAIRDRTNALVDQILEIWPAFGESPSMHDYTGKKPVRLRVRNENYTVSTFKDMTVQMAEIVASNNSNFDEFALKYPQYFARQAHRYSTHPLSNGWWLFYNFASNKLVWLCEQLALHAGLSGEDWDFIIRN